MRWLEKAGASVDFEEQEVEVDQLLSYEGEGLEKFKDVEIKKGHIKN